MLSIFIQLSSVKKFITITAPMKMTMQLIQILEKTVSSGKFDIEIFSQFEAYFLNRVNLTLYLQRIIQNLL